MLLQLVQREQGFVEDLAMDGHCYDRWLLRKSKTGEREAGFVVEQLGQQQLVATFVIS